MHSRKPEVLSFRVSRQESALIEAAAAKDGVSISELLRRLIVPAVYQRMAALLHEHTGRGR
jgi:uncharacterized protein (DUF1778 family)